MRSDMFSSNPIMHIWEGWRDVVPPKNPFFSRSRRAAALLDREKEDSRGRPGALWASSPEPRQTVKLEHRQLLKIRRILLGRCSGLLFRGLALGLLQELRQTTEISLDQRPVLHLMQRSGWMHHRHNQPASNPARLTMNARDLLARKPLCHREAPQRNNHPWIDRGDLALQITRAGGNLFGLRV